MHETAKKSINIWTDKHEIYCLENKVNKVAQHLWRFFELQLKKYPHAERELCVGIDEFENYITEKCGKPFTRSWVKQELEKLQSLRVVKIVKQFGRGATCGYKLLLKQVDSLFPPKKNPKRNLSINEDTFNLDTSNEVNIKQEDNSSSNSNSNITNEVGEELPNIPTESMQYEEIERRYNLLELCARHGIYYHPNKPQTEALFNFNIEEIQLALNHFEKSGGHGIRYGKSIIPNPPGWLLSCLYGCWWEEQATTFTDYLLVLSEFLPKNIARDYA